MAHFKTKNNSNQIENGMNGTNNIKVYGPDGEKHQMIKDERKRERMK